jgi:hypothetical protein
MELEDLAAEEQILDIRQHLIMVSLILAAEVQHTAEAGADQVMEALELSY